MRNEPWWKKHDGEQCQVVFFQIDLSGHSDWLASEAPIQSLADARRAFAQDVERALAAIKFERLFWAGDGGVFCRELISTSDAEAVFPAADEVFRCFSALQRPYPSLKIRVSATCSPYVVVYREGSDMCSTRLNAFIKYERDIALNDAFVIDGQLRSRMGSDNERVCKLVPDKRGAELPTHETIARWIDSKHAYKIVPSEKSFRNWLALKRSHGELPSSRIISPDPLHFVVGQSIVLDSALEPYGYRNIRLKALSSRSADTIVDAPDRETWAANRDRLVENNERGVKLTVSYFEGEESDHPYVELGWRQGYYEDAKAFNSILESTGGTVVRDRYLQRALEVEKKHMATLGLLGNFAVVLLKSGEEQRDVLIAHRRVPLGRRGGFFGNCWSVSFEEQFRPIEEERGGKTYPADANIKEGIVRGAKEEFLGQDCTTPMSVTVHAFILEATNLNYAFLSILDLPEISFDDVCRLWPSAQDSREHDAVAAIPLRADLLRKSMLSEDIPTEIWNEIMHRGKLHGSTDLSTEDLHWHPSSPVRLALALWRLENAI